MWGSNLSALRELVLHVADTLCRIITYLKKRRMIDSDHLLGVVSAFQTLCRNRVNCLIKTIARASNSPGRYYRLLGAHQWLSTPPILMSVLWAHITGPVGAIFWAAIQCWIGFRSIPSVGHLQLLKIHQPLSDTIGSDVKSPNVDSVNPYSVRGCTRFDPAIRVWRECLHPSKRMFWLNNRTLVSPTVLRRRTASTVSAIWFICFHICSDERGSALSIFVANLYSTD